MRIAHDRLKQLVAAIFAAGGCNDAEAERIGHYLVEANLAGHDSHGVIRVSAYIEWLRGGQVVPNQKPRVVMENDVILVLDGGYGFGQVQGEEAMKLGIAKAAQQGAAIVGLRNSAHLGRIGEWALMCARANKLSFHFVNTNGAGILAAPFGGISRRLSANPIAAGVPIRGREPLVLDISTCMIAEGKVRVALHKGVPVPPGCLIDAQGRPTTDPKAFYGPPAGAILPMAGHKGYGLAVIAEMFAGAFFGGRCSDPDVKRVSNNMLTVLIDPSFFGSEDEFAREATRFIAFVKSAEKASPDADILMPGEIEERTRAKRLRDGIDLDDTTWGKILDSARLVNVPKAKLDSLIPSGA